MEETPPVKIEPYLSHTTLNVVQCPQSSSNNHPLELAAKTIAEILRVYQLRHGFAVPVSAVRKKIDTDMPESSLSSCLKTLFGPEIRVIGGYCFNLGMKAHQNLLHRERTQIESSKLDVAEARKVEGVVVTSGSDTQDNELNLLVTDVRSAYTPPDPPETQSTTHPHQMNIEPCDSTQNQSVPDCPAGNVGSRKHGYGLKGEWYHFPCRVVKSAHLQHQTNKELPSGDSTDGHVVETDSQKRSILLVEDAPKQKVIALKLNDCKIPAQILKFYQLRHGSSVLLSSVRQKIGTDMSDSALSSCLNFLFGQDVCVKGEYCVNLGLIESSRQDKKNIPEQNETVLSAKKPIVRPQPTIVEGTKVSWPFSSKTQNSRELIVTKTHEAKEKQEKPEHDELEPGDRVVKSDEQLIVCAMADDQESQTKIAMEQDVEEPCAADSQLEGNKKELTDEQMVHLIQEKISETYVQSHNDAVQVSDIIAMLRASGLQLPPSDIKLRKLTIRAVVKAMKYKVKISTYNMETLTHMKWRNPELYRVTVYPSKTPIPPSKPSAEMQKLMQSKEPGSGSYCLMDLVYTLKSIVRKRLEYTADDSTMELSAIMYMIRQLGLPTKISDEVLRPLTKRAVVQGLRGKVTVDISRGREVLRNLKWKPSYVNPTVNVDSTGVVSTSVTVPHTLPVRVVHHTATTLESATIQASPSPAKPPANLAKITNATSTSIVSTVPHTAKTRVPTIIKSVDDTVSSSGPESDNADIMTSRNLMREYQGADLEEIEQFILKYYYFKSGECTPIIQIFAEIIEAGYHDVKRDQLLWLIRKFFGNKIVIDIHKREFFIGIRKIPKIFTLSSDDDEKTEKQYPGVGTKPFQEKFNVRLTANEFEALRCLKRGDMLEAAELVHARDDETLKKQVMLAAKKMMRTEQLKFVSSSASDILKDQNPVTVENISFLDLFRLYREQLPLTMEFFRPCFSTNFSVYKEKNAKKAQSESGADKDKNSKEANMVTEWKQTAALITKMLGLMFRKLSAYRQYVFSILVSGDASTQVMFDLAQLGDSLYPAHLKAMRNYPQKHFKRCWGSEDMELEMKAVIEKVEKRGPPSWYKRPLKSVNFSERTKSWQKKRADVSDPAEDVDQKQRIVSARRKVRTKEQTSPSNSDKGKRTRKRKMSDQTILSPQQEHARRMRIDPENREFYDMVIYSPGVIHSPRRDKQIKHSKQSESSTTVVQSDQSRTPTRSDKDATSNSLDLEHSGSLPKHTEIWSAAMANDHTASTAVSDLEGIDSIEMLESLLGDNQQSIDNSAEEDDSRTRCSEYIDL